MRMSAMSSMVSGAAKRVIPDDVTAAEPVLAALLYAPRHALRLHQLAAALSGWAYMEAVEELLDCQCLPRYGYTCTEVYTTAEELVLAGYLKRSQHGYQLAKIEEGERAARLLEEADLSTRLLRYLVNIYARLTELEAVLHLYYTIIGYHCGQLSAKLGEAEERREELACSMLRKGVITRDMFWRIARIAPEEVCGGDGA